MNQYISKMKAPGDKRNTWGNGIIQVHITRACDLACVGCTQGSNLAGKPVMMTRAQFETSILSLSTYYGVLGVFGGNPCIHPDFEWFCHSLKKLRPKQLCGLWSNNLNGYGRLCRETFNPEFSNLNVHCSESAYYEIMRDWPEALPKGLKDSRHSPPYVALQDMEDMNDEERWKLITTCDINQLWSAMICVFRGELRGFFCELAGAQSMLHQNEISYPDTGMLIRPEWWKLPIETFTGQIMKHCFECGIPLRGMGDLAITGNQEQVSKTHENIYKFKTRGKELKLIRNRSELGGEVKRATDYIENGVL